MFEKELNGIRVESDSVLSEGKKVTRKRYYAPDNDLLSEEYYDDGKREGLFKSFYNKKLIRLQRYKGGKLFLLKDFYDNGNLEFEAHYHYHDGIQKGVEKSYYDNGHLSNESQSLDGEEVGISKYYTEDGKFDFEFDHDEVCE